VSNNPTYHMMQSEEFDKVLCPIYEVPTTNTKKVEDNPAHFGRDGGIKVDYPTTDLDIKMTENPSYAVPWLWTPQTVFSFVDIISFSATTLPHYYILLPYCYYITPHATFCSCIFVTNLI